MAQGHIWLQKDQKESVITNYIAFIIIFVSVFTYFLKHNSSPFIIIACKRVTLLKIYHGRIKKMILVWHNMWERKWWQTLNYRWTVSLRPKTHWERSPGGRGSHQSAHEGLLTLTAKPPCVQNKQTDGEVWNPCTMSKEQKYLLHHIHFASLEKMFKTSKQVHV